MKPMYKSRSKAHAAVAAALSLSLAFGGAVAALPSVSFAKEEDSGEAYTDDHSILIYLKGVDESALGPGGYEGNITVSITNSDGSTTVLSYESDLEGFFAETLKDGEYTVHVTINNKDYIVSKSADENHEEDDGEQAFNGGKVTLKDPKVQDYYYYLLLAKAQNVEYTPTGTSLETQVGTTPNAEDGITNKDALPKGTTYEWETEPNVSVEGESTGVVKVIYPDGTTDLVDVPVTAKLGLQKVTVVVHDARGAEYPVTEAIKDLKVSITDAESIDHKLAQDEGDNNFQFKAQDLKPGDYTLSVEGLSNDYRLVAAGEETYLSEGLKPQQVFNGSTLALKDAQNGASTFYLIIAQKQSGQFTPEATPLETEVNKSVNVEDGISNKDTLPEGTTYEWKTEPDTSVAGSTMGTAKVVYPDGSFDLVEVPVTVTAAPETPNPGPTDPKDPADPKDPTGTPETPGTDPANPTDTPATDDGKAPSTVPQTKPAVTSDVKVQAAKKALPQTGDPASAAAALAAGLGGLGVAASAAIRRKR